MSEVKVFISDMTVIQATNTPGGVVFGWRDDFADTVVRDCREHSPVNKPINAVHRGGEVGTLKAGWAWTPIGSNQHIVRAVIHNFSDHAEFVEWGRSSSRKKQRFSSTWSGGKILWSRFTPGRRGQFVMAKAVNRALVAQGLYPVAYQG